MLEITGTSESSDIPQGVIKYLQYVKIKSGKLNVIPDSVNQQWPPSLGQSYHDLELREIKRELPNKETVATYLRQLSHGKATRETTLMKRITLDEIFTMKDIEHPEAKEAKILVTGVPGIGKSTIARKICHDWALNAFASHFILVLLFCLRDKSVYESNSLLELIKYQYPYYAEEVTQYLLDTLGINVLFLLDGWDELPSKLQANSVFLDFIQNRMLPCCSVLVFSRSYAAGALKVLPSITRHIDIVGFTTNQVKECVKANIYVEADAQKVLQQMQVKKHITSTCYVPLNLAILLYVSKLYNYVLPQTYTKLYQIFVHNALLRHLKTQPTHQHIKVLHEIEQLPEEIRSHFFQLCLLALDGLMTEKVVFQQEDIDKYFPNVKLTMDSVQDVPFLGMLTSMQSYSAFGEEEQYQFVHVNFQEYLAAWWLAFQFSLNDRLLFFESYRDNQRLERTLVFTAGLTHLNDKEYFPLLCAPVMFIDLTKHVKKLIGCRTASEYMLFILEMLFESENKIQVKLFADSIQCGKLYFRIDLSSNHQSLLIVNDFIINSEKVWETVQFDSNSPVYSDFLMDTFDTELSEQHSLGRVEEIHLQNFMKLDDVVLFLNMLPFAITSKISLTYFHDSCVDDTLRLILNQRKWISVHLTHWDIHDCSNLKGIFETMGSIKSLEVFHYKTFNEISVPPLNQACQVSLNSLITRLCNLHSLCLNRCGINSSVIETIVFSIAGTTTLRKLDLSYNSIGRQGQTLIFQNLATNNSLESLVLVSTHDNNDMKEQKDLKKLYTALVQMLTMNNKLTLLDLSKCVHFDINLGKWIAVGLAVNRSLKCLLLNSTDLSVDSALNIFLSLNKNHCLTSFSLRDINFKQTSESKALKDTLSKLSSFLQIIMNFFQCLSGMETYLNSKASDLTSRISISFSDLISTVSQLINLIKEADELITSYTVKIKLILLDKCMYEVAGKKKTLSLDLRGSLHHSEPIAKALYKKNTLNTLSIGYISNNGVNKLFNALLYNTSLHTLILDGAEINDEGLQLLTKVLNCNTTLSSLKILGMDVKTNVIQAVAASLFNNSTLTELSITEEHINCIIPDLIKINDERRSKGLSPVRLHCEPHQIETLSNTPIDYFVLRAFQAAKRGVGKFHWTAK